MLTLCRLSSKVLVRVRGNGRKVVVATSSDGLLVGKEGRLCSTGG